MAPRDLPPTGRAAIFWQVNWVPVIALLFVAGCASAQRSGTGSSEAVQAEVADRVLVPADLNVNPAESVVKPGAPGRSPSDPIATRDGGVGRTTFSLADAIDFARRSSPRLRSARAALNRGRGQEQVAFAPFLPQVDILSQYGVVSSTLAPGIPGSEGFLLPDGSGTRSYAQAELGLQWTLYDFGRTGGHYGQAVARERITELQLTRAEQTVDFDVAVAYMDVLLARASRRVQEDAVRRAEATLQDTVSRQKGGVALKEDVLRADVQLSESRDALVVAREGEFNSLARLNHAMGRNTAWPLEVVDLEVQPPLPGALAELLERAAAQRPEVALVRQAVVASQEGERAARGEFLPRIYARGAAGHTDGQGVITGWQEGAGLHVDIPLYAGGRHRGELLSAEADIEAAFAEAQSILNDISLQVNLAYRGVVAARERIELSRTAVVQSEENLRLVRVRYRNGTATSTDIVDSEAAVTRSQQRFFSTTYTYLEALARLNYAMGQNQGAFPGQAGDSNQKQKAVAEKVPASPAALPLP